MSSFSTPYPLMQYHATMQIMDPTQDPPDGATISTGGRLCLMPLDVLRLISTKLWRRDVAMWRMAHMAFVCVPLPGLVSRGLPTQSDSRRSVCNSPPKLRTPETRHPNWLSPTPLKHKPCPPLPLMPEPQHPLNINLAHRSH